MIVKIAHIADVHLRDRQYTYESRGADFSTGFLNAIDTAIANGADAIICAGDLLDTSRPSAKVVVDTLVVTNTKLEQAGVKMFVISGNHDKSKAAWAEMFATRESPGIVNLDWREATVGDVTIKGYPFMQDADMKSEMQKLRDSQSRYDIIVWHGALKEFAGYTQSADAISMRDFVDTCRLLALGDQHIHKQLDKYGYTAAYPGSTELCSESEDAEKKLLMYTWDGHDLIDTESIPFKTKPVQRFVIKTELDLENAITQINSNAIVFVKFDDSVTSVIPRLNTILTPENILRPTAIPTPKENIVTFEMSVGEGLMSPVEFVKENISQVITTEQSSRVTELCMAMVDVNADHKYALDKFCADKMEGKIIL